MVNEMNKYNSCNNVHIAVLGTPQYPNRDITIKALSAQIISLIFSRVHNVLGVVVKDFTCFDLNQEINVIPDDQEIYEVIKLSKINMAIMYVYAYVYLLRLVKYSRIQVTARNWLLLFLSCVSLAQKKYDDKPTRSSSFSCIYFELFSHEQFLKCEKMSFESIRNDSDFQVIPSKYCKVYYLLRNLGILMTSNIKFNVMPVKVEIFVIESKKMEDIFMKKYQVDCSIGKTVDDSLYNQYIKSFIILYDNFHTFV